MTIGLDMSHKKVISLAKRFLIKLADEPWDYKPDEDPGLTKAPSFVERKSTEDLPELSPELQELARKYKAREAETSTGNESEQMSSPGAAPAEDRDFDFTLGRYFRTIFRGIESDISDLVQLRFFHGYHRKTMNHNYLFAYKEMTKLNEIAKELMNKSKNDPYDTARIYLVYINENISNIMRAAKIVYDFTVNDNGRMPPVGFPTAIEVYKAILNNAGIISKYPSIHKHLVPPDMLNKDFLVPREKISQKMYYLQLLCA